VKMDSSFVGSTCTMCTRVACDVEVHLTVVHPINAIYSRHVLSNGCIQCPQFGQMRRIETFRCVQVLSARRQRTWTGIKAVGSPAADCCLIIAGPPARLLVAGTVLPVKCGLAFCRSGWIHHAISEKPRGSCW
jgi:hypothetical protein